MSKKKKSTVLRELLLGKEILFRPLVAIPLHAVMAEAAGFKVVGISGGHTASHILGLPDAGLITMTEMVENAQRVAAAVNIPVMVDCDTGGGNAINVRRTVDSMIRAGTAALFIEDQVAPKRCGFVKGKELVSVEEAVGKYRAAIDARNELDPDYIIMARTDARTAVGGSLEEVISRCVAYKKAGVDALYVEALQSRDEIRAVRAAVEGPMACSCRAIRPQPSLQELQDMGMSLTVGVGFFVAGLTAMWDLLVEMRTRGLDPYLEYLERTKDHPASTFHLFDMVGFPKIREWEEAYLQPEQLAKYNESLGLYEPKAQG